MPQERLGGTPHLRRELRCSRDANDSSLSLGVRTVVAVV